MYAGVVGLVSGSPERLGSFEETVTQDGFDLTRCVEVDRVFSLPDGTHATSGRAAVERVKQVEEVDIEDGHIEPYREPQKITTYTEFLMVPGEFVVVDSSDGAFAFDLVQDETGGAIERTGLDTAAFRAAHDGDLWKLGYADPDGGTGVVYGDPDGSGVSESAVPRGATTTQVGLTHDYRDDRVKMTLTRSGYVAVYRPGEWDGKEFLQYLQDEVVGHATGPSE